MRHIRTFQVVILLCSLWLAGPSRADSQITITGKVTPGTCAVSHPAVTWAPLSAADIKSHGRISRSTKFFDIAITDCVGVTSATLTFGAVGDRDPIETDTFRNTASAPAPHLSIWLQQAKSGKCPDHYFTFEPGKSYGWNLDSTETVLPVCATYWNNGSNNVTAGDVSATIAVSVTYH